MGDLDGDVKQLKKTFYKLKGEMRFQRRLREEDKKNSSTSREILVRGPLCQYVAALATIIEIDKDISMLAPSVDRILMDVVVQATVLLLVNTSSVQAHRQVVTKATLRTYYTSVVTQVTLVPTGPHIETSGGPAPLVGVWGLSL